MTLAQIRAWLATAPAKQGAEALLSPTSPGVGRVRPRSPRCDHGLAARVAKFAGGGMIEGSQWLSDAWPARSNAGRHRCSTGRAL